MSLGGQPPLHCPVIRHHGLVVETVHPLYLLIQGYIAILGQNQRGCVNISLPVSLFSAGGSSVPGFHGPSGPLLCVVSLQGDVGYASIP